MLDFIYPGRKEHGWIPLVWLMYLVFFFVDPFTHPSRPIGYVGTLVVGLFFIVLYLRAYTSSGPWSMLITLTMVLLGVLCTPWNSGAVGFFIYAAACLAWQGNFRKVATLLAVI